MTTYAIKWQVGAMMATPRWPNLRWMLLFSSAEAV